MNASRINALYVNARLGDGVATEGLFELLSARFQLIAYQRIWNDSDAEEVAQEALAVVLAEYKSVEITSSFAAWSYKVLDNKILSYIQTKRRRLKHVGRDTETPGGDIAGFLGVDPEFKRRLILCLRKLGEVNPRYARVLNFAHQGFDTDNICRRLDLKRSTFYSLLSRARSMLMNCLEKGDIS